MSRALRMLAIALFLPACDASEPLPFVPTYDPLSSEPVSSTEFCALLARNTCAVLRPCCDGSAFAFDETKCRTNARLLCEARRQKSMELGLLYDDVQAGRCVRGTAILMRECRLVTDDPVAADVVEACRVALHGTKTLGTPCDGKTPVECAPPGLGERVTCRGVCSKVELAKGGEDCIPGSIECEAGLVCDGTTLPRRCSAQIHPLGSPCDACSAGPCANDLRCGDSNFCDPDAKPAPVCAALPTDGQPCTTRGCSKPWRCDTDKGGNQVCTDGKGVGEPCGDDAECGSRLCIGFGLKLCAPPAMGDPIASESLARSEPQNYLTRTAAACQGVIPDGAGGLAPLLPFPADVK
ncbi:MAG: hypothetical protein ACXWUG_04295 [Polyangiales bacterium]